MKRNWQASDVPASLQVLVRDRLRVLGLSYEAAAARSSGLVSHGTLHRLAVGKHQGRLREGTIQGVALALDIAQSAVREVLPSPPVPGSRRFTLPPRADQLDVHDRRLVLDHIDRLLARQAVGDPVVPRRPVERPKS